MGFEIVLVGSYSTKYLNVLTVNFTEQKQAETVG